jgi:predicted transcriptional regulator
MPTKSIKLHWNEKAINNGDVLAVLFGDRRDTLDAARTLIGRMRSKQNLSMTKREMRFFAKDLEKGTLGVKYSYHNFYMKLLKKLLEMGFVEKDVLIWDDKRKKTEAVYQLRLQSIPERGPQGGFIKQAWQLAKGWNDLVRQS